MPPPLPKKKKQKQKLKDLLIQLAKIQVIKFIMHLSSVTDNTASFKSGMCTLYDKGRLNKLNW